MRKRNTVLCFILSLAMMLTAIPSAVFADGENAESSLAIAEEYKDNPVLYSDGEIKFLAENVTLPSEYTVSVGSDDSWETLNEDAYTVTDKNGTPEITITGSKAPLESYRNYYLKLSFDSTELTSSSFSYLEAIEEYDLPSNDRMLCNTISTINKNISVYINNAKYHDIEDEVEITDIQLDPDWEQPEGFTVGEDPDDKDSLYYSSGSKTGTAKISVSYKEYGTDNILTTSFKVEVAGFYSEYEMEIDTENGRRHFLPGEEATVAVKVMKRTFDSEKDETYEDVTDSISYKWTCQDGQSYLKNFESNGNKAKVKFKNTSEGESLFGGCNISVKLLDENGDEIMKSNGLPYEEDISLLVNEQYTIVSPEDLKGELEAPGDTYTGKFAYTEFSVDKPEGTVVKTVKEDGEDKAVKYFWKYDPSEIRIEDLGDCEWKLTRLTNEAFWISLYAYWGEDKSDSERREEASYFFDAAPEDNEAVEKAIALISAIPSKVTLKNEAAVTKARKAYDALTENQKYTFDPDVLSILENAEQTIKDLKAYNKNVKSAKKAKVKLVSVKAKGATRILAKWKTGKNVCGYQLRYSTNKKFKKAKKIKLNNPEKYKTLISQLSPGKKYYVQVRPVKKVKNTATGKTKKVAGTWSKAKTVKLRS